MKNSLISLGLTSYLLSAALSSASEPPAPSTGIETDAAFQQMSSQVLQNFEFHGSSAKEIGRTFAALLQKELLMKPADDVMIDIPSRASDTVEKAWSRFVAALRNCGLDVEASKKAIKIFYPKAVTKRRCKEVSPSIR